MNRDGERENPEQVEPEAPPIDAGRRNFVRGSMIGGAAALGALTAPSLAQAELSVAKSSISHYHVPASDKSVHWGYFSKKLAPLVEINSGDFVTMETITHHAYDDFDRMIKGDPGCEAIFYWDKKRKGVDRRGGAARCFALRARSGRGARRSYLHRSSCHQRGRTGRHSRGAHPRRETSRLCKP